ncbi:hypothetical protein M885DRAFT_616036 [Pelagophyceae sp. CCMP2097]|nr:hypothetical protein M885DRAFT_616036 [Pelagophyceae sp. CCMP2097]
MVVLRVRHSGGTTRLTLEDAATLADVSAALREARVADAAAEFSMSLDPAGREPMEGDPATAISALGLKHGSMIYLHAAQEEAEAPPPQQSTLASAGAAVVAPEPATPQAAPFDGFLDEADRLEYEVAAAIAAADDAERAELEAMTPRAPDASVREALVGPNADFDDDDDDGFPRDPFAGLPPELLARLAAASARLGRGAAPPSSATFTEPLDDDEDDAYARRLRALEANGDGASFAADDGSGAEDPDAALARLLAAGDARTPAAPARRAFGGAADGGDDDDAALQAALLTSCAGAAPTRGFGDHDGFGDDDDELERALALSLGDGAAPPRPARSAAPPAARDDDEDDVALQAALFAARADAPDYEFEEALRLSALESAAAAGEPVPAADAAPGDAPQAARRGARAAGLQEAEAEARAAPSRHRKAE